MGIEISLLHQEVQLEEQYVTLTMNCKEGSVASSAILFIS